MSIRCLVDTNIILVGAFDLSADISSSESKILQLMISRKIRPIVTMQLLNEYHEAAKRIMGKDFASWMRYLIVDICKPIYVSDEICRELEPKFHGIIPEEDLRHFVSCILGEADYLISNNREFLKMSKNNSFECLTPNEFLREVK